MYHYVVIFVVTFCYKGTTHEIDVSPIAFHRDPQWPRWEWACQLLMELQEKRIQANVVVYSSVLLACHWGQKHIGSNTRCYL